MRFFYNWDIFGIQVSSPSFELLRLQHPIISLGRIATSMSSKNFVGTYCILTNYRVGVNFITYQKQNVLK